MRRYRLQAAGQHVQGTELGDAGTLVRALDARYGPGVRLVHRIDAPASGLTLAGRDRNAVRLLASQVCDHTLECIYRAITAAAPCALGLVRTGRITRTARSDEDAIPAQTGSAF